MKELKTNKEHIYGTQSISNIVNPPNPTVKFIREHYTPRGNIKPQNANSTNIFLSSGSGSSVRASGRDPDSSKMLRIPALRDENGRDLLSDDTSPDKSSPKGETEWTSDAIRAFDRVWHDPARRKQPGCFQTGSGESSRTAVSQSRQTLAPDTYPTPHRMITLEQSRQY